MAELRSELTELPARIKRLPVSDRGYPVPWFVEWIDGKPDFRVMSSAKMARAINEKRCWVCGDVLGRHLTFPIGPMCCLSCTTPEPPSHLECAQWSAINCPFLSRPNMVRHEDEFTKSIEGNTAGEAIKRNPGVIALWTTRSYSVFRDDKGRPLIRVGPPERVEWFAEGRAATRAEVLASIDSGYPLLDSQCDRERTALDRIDSRRALQARRVEVEALLLPREIVTA